MASEFVDLVARRRRCCRVAKGGTGNAYGWAYGVITSQYNNTGSTWPLYSTLAYFPGGGPGGSNPQLTTTANPGPFLGVVVGTLDPVTGLITPGDVANRRRGGGADERRRADARRLGRRLRLVRLDRRRRGHGPRRGRRRRRPRPPSASSSRRRLVYLLAGGGAVSRPSASSPAVAAGGRRLGRRRRPAIASTRATSPWACDITSVVLLGRPGRRCGGGRLGRRRTRRSADERQQHRRRGLPDALVQRQHYEDSHADRLDDDRRRRDGFRLNVVSASTVTALTLWLMVRQT